METKAGGHREVNFRGGRHSRCESLPVAVPEHTVGLGDVGAEPTKRCLTITKCEALKEGAELLPERRGPVT